MRQAQPSPQLGEGRTQKSNTPCTGNTGPAQGRQPGPASMPLAPTKAMSRRVLRCRPWPQPVRAGGRQRLDHAAFVLPTIGTRSRADPPIRSAFPRRPRVAFRPCAWPAILQDAPASRPHAHEVARPIAQPREDVGFHVGPSARVWTLSDGSMTGPIRAKVGPSGFKPTHLGHETVMAAPYFLMAKSASWRS